MGNYAATSADHPPDCVYPEVNETLAARIIFNAYGRHAAKDVYQNLRVHKSLLSGTHVLDDYFHADRALPWDRAGLKDDIRILQS
jgi:hypothetical protein